MTIAVGAIPDRFLCLKNFLKNKPMEFYFALARGHQKDGFDITPMEMTKWFDTNYHYIVPELKPGLRFRYSEQKYSGEFSEAKESGIITKPVLPGPVSYLMLGKTETMNFDKLTLLPNLLDVYVEILKDLIQCGAKWVQLDEPFLVTDLIEQEREAFRFSYEFIRKSLPDLKIIVATYFGDIGDNTGLAVNLPVDALHVDLVRAPASLKEILNKKPEKLMISLGIVDGRNIWKNDFANSLRLIKSAVERSGNDSVMIAPSCSLIHSPQDLDTEKDERILPSEIKNWMAFSKQKLEEVVELKNLSMKKINDISDDLNLFKNHTSLLNRKNSVLVHNDKVRERMGHQDVAGKSYRSNFSIRKLKQQQKLNLPFFPTTTIGSFPQTREVRGWRSVLKKGELSESEYKKNIRDQIRSAIRWQEETGLDVLVHGEFERNDMVEYFGEMLDGFVFTQNGWIQSYGTRYVKPPVIFGDVYRSKPMTIDWIKYAQSLTDKPVKGMLTGPVTILQWSFVRDDQPRSETCLQIALAIREEVLDLEKAGIPIIQIDEPALREGLPLRKTERPGYLDWAVQAFRTTYSGIRDETQIHTHMCYSEFNDIMEQIAALDADVITIESSRSKMELLEAFSEFEYPNDIGPGIYDIHSPRIPDSGELAGLLEQAIRVIPAERLWVNPDCGLKTRNWEETRTAIANMVKAARLVKEKYAITAK
jgi:5-methyltetrahydropteroyltriglutamate--homocysteine methyltransferase